MIGFIIAFCLFSCEFYRLLICGIGLFIVSLTYWPSLSPSCFFCLFQLIQRCMNCPVENTTFLVTAPFLWRSNSSHLNRIYLRIGETGTIIETLPENHFYGNSFSLFIIEFLSIHSWTTLKTCILSAPLIKEKVDCILCFLYCILCLDLV